jgi:hypothetical protein
MKTEEKDWKSATTDDIGASGRHAVHGGADSSLVSYVSQSCVFIILSQ